MIRRLILAAGLCLAGLPAWATCVLPNTLLPNTLADATAVMADFNALNACINATSLVPSTAFWSGPAVDQTRIPWRLFVGGGVADSGFGVVPQADWLSQLTQAGQGDSPFGTGVYATAYFLTNPSAVAGTPANIATPSEAIMAGNSTLNGVSTGPATYSTPRTIECAMVNNVTAAASGGGPNVPDWCGYFVAGRQTVNSGQSYVLELEAFTFAGAVTGWTPYNTTANGTIGLEWGCGAGLAATGQSDCTVMAYGAANPKKWGAGIIMLNGSIDAVGPSSTITALALPDLYEIQWYNTDLRGRVFLDASSNMNILSPNGGLNITGQINSAASTNAFLNAPAGQVAGLSVTGTTPNVNFNASGLVPSTNNSLTLGSASLQWNSGFIKTLTVDALPTSAGAGGVNVCVDNVGVFYKKAACP